MTTLRVIRRLLGGEWGQQCIISKVAIISKVFTVTSSCVDYLWQFAVQISCWVHILVSSVEIVCWGHLLRWNQLSRLPVKVSPWVYLLRSMFEIHIICSFSCWDSQANHFLRFEIEVIYRGQIMTLFVEIDRWTYLFRSTWDQLLRLAFEINRWEYLLRSSWDYMLWSIDDIDM